VFSQVTILSLLTEKVLPNTWPQWLVVVATTRQQERIADEFIHALTISFDALGSRTMQSLQAFFGPIGDEKLMNKLLMTAAGSFLLQMTRISPYTTDLGELDIALFVAVEERIIRRFSELFEFYLGPLCYNRFVMMSGSDFIILPVVGTFLDALRML